MASTLALAVHYAAPGHPEAGMDGGPAICDRQWRGPAEVTSGPDLMGRATCPACLQALAASTVHMQPEFNSPLAVCSSATGKRSPWPGRVTCPDCSQWATENPDLWPSPLPHSLRSHRLAS